MKHLLLDYSDGAYTTRPLDDAEASQLEAQGVDVAHVEDHIYDAYLRHCEQDGIWQALWRAIANEQYVQRRQRELLPLEEAQREIERLREELARAQRMEKFYEVRHAEQLAKRHHAEHTEFTCVFPQPGCQIDALPQEWQERAQEILAQYSDSRAAAGIQAQGCCCGHHHKKLDAANVDLLRNCGFLIEHDAEVELP